MKEHSASAKWQHIDYNDEVRYLSIAGAFVFAGTVHEQRMEEDHIALLHLQVQAEPSLLLVIVDSEVGLVDLSFPLGIDVSVELVSVGLRKDVQRTIFFGRVFQTCPGRHDSIGWPEREVGEILVEGMSRTGSHMGRLVDEHGVDRLNVAPAEAPEVRSQLRIGAEGE